MGLSYRSSLRTLVCHRLLGSIYVVDQGQFVSRAPMRHSMDSWAHRTPGAPTKRTPLPPLDGHFQSDQEPPQLSKKINQRRLEQISNTSKLSIVQLVRFKQSWAITQDSGFVTWRLGIAIVSFILFMTLFLIYIMFLSIMFLVCFGSMLDIAIVNTKFMHRFIKLLAQYRVG